MIEYTEGDLLRLAKRRHNTRRTYLLVDPLQGKHMPVSPAAALRMMRALGERLSAQTPGIDLVIGFAETATAVAAAAAMGMERPCRYIHTTREGFPAGDAIDFLEEHSHAVEQRLCLERLRTWIDGASGIALVDDELSTGKTMLNAIGQLRAACPSMASKRVTVASIISRLGDGRVRALAEMGVDCVSLLRLPEGDYSDAVRGYQIEGARTPTGTGMAFEELALSSAGDARLGVLLPEWADGLSAAFGGLAERLRGRLAGKRVTVLGTEEYMLPGLLLGALLEADGAPRSVRFHATTRSPIGICRDEGYPIRAGWRLRSFYDAQRPTFIYNLEPCDVALVVTDSPDGAAARLAMGDLTAALMEAGCGEALLIREERHVQHL